MCSCISVRHDKVLMQSIPQVIESVMADTVMSYSACVCTGLSSKVVCPDHILILCTLRKPMWGNLRLGGTSPTPPP